MHPGFKKFLLPDQVLPQLRAGRRIEQWLGHKYHDGFRSITYITISFNKREGFIIYRSEVIDEGRGDFLDVGEFSQLDGESDNSNTTTHTTPEKAIQAAIQSYGATMDKFIGNGMIQEVYAAFLAENGEPPRPDQPI